MQMLCYSLSKKQISHLAQQVSSFLQETPQCVHANKVTQVPECLQDSSQRENGSDTISKLKIPYFVTKKALIEVWPALATSGFVFNVCLCERWWDKNFPWAGFKCAVTNSCSGKKSIKYDTEETFFHIQIVGGIRREVKLAFIHFF